MIEIIKWKDNDDGSADVTFQISEEEETLFAKLGIITTIKEGIKKLKEGEKLNE